MIYNPAKAPFRFSENLNFKEGEGDLEGAPPLSLSLCHALCSKEASATAEEIADTAP